MRLKWKLTVASLKMFVRQREAIIWTVLLPIFMIVLFGLVDFGGIGKVNVGLVGGSNGIGQELADGLGEVRALELFHGSREQELELLLRGERDLVVFIPESSGEAGGVVGYVNDAAPEEAQLASVIVQSVLDRLVFEVREPGNRTMLTVNTVHGRAETYIDFLVPGVIAMSIMQMGIFGVAFSFVSLKKRGILRRLSATPIRPNDFVLGQILMRLVVVVVQISLLVAVGVLFLGVHFGGSLGDMFVLGVIGAVVFLAIGFAIAGVSKSEDQVAPLANVVAMPMILLCGVFFSRSGLPDVVHMLTGFLPLTYLADGMRAVAIEGATLTEVLPDLTGLLLWAIVAGAGAIRFFRWE
ncbi:MAG: ABC transporter permease [Ignavibacteria bacterium]|nr:ABC transporter permease [Ignavibacteria bacterium]